MKNFLIIISIIAYIGNALGSVNSANIRQTTSSPLSTRAGNCIKGSNSAILKANNVRALILNTGDLWWDRTNAAYEVPKRSDQQVSEGKLYQSPLYAGSIWISGKTGGNLRMAALTYSNGSTQSFFPGPIINYAPDVKRERCSKFDKYWTVTKDDIEMTIEFLKTGKGEIPKAVKEWPGKGNQVLISSGQFSAEEMSEPLAPFYDKDADCIYNPLNGDLPSIFMSSSSTSCASEKCNELVYADQMIFWVINDVGNVHVDPAATPIGVQMNCLAFSFKSSDELNDMSFYTYNITNKSNVTLEETYITQNMDADLGNYGDDYIGCDTTRSLGYIYNGDNNDEERGQNAGYGTQPPIFGADFFEGPKRNGVQIGMSSFSYYLNGADPVRGDPQTDIQFRNYQIGKSRNGQSLTISNTCFEPAGTPTNFCYHGDPSKSTEWSMCKANAPIVQPGDYRWIQNSGPFDMVSGKPEVVTVGLVFARPPTGSQNACIPVMSYIRDADDKAQRLFDACFKISPGPDAPELKIIEAPNALYISIFNEENSNNYGENYDNKSLDIPLSSWNKDTTYKFEGYAIYQIVNENAISGLTDLQDPNKAKLVKLMDLRNNINSGVNFSNATVNGTTITLVTQNLTLPNEGITRDFKVSRDLFEFEGVGDLVNNKTYYYATVAFAFNNYKNQVNALEFQKNQLKFSNAVKIFKGTPHNNDFWGVKTKAEYYQTLDVKRISGQGHGRYFLDLVSGEEDKILKDNSVSELIYKGGSSPISVSITDPFKVKNAKFKLTMIDTSLTQDQDKYVHDSSYWRLDITENGSNKVVYSEGTLDREFSQKISAKEANNELISYGISIGQSYPNALGKVDRNGNNYYGTIGASIKYVDSSKQWLKLVQDKDNTAYEDWIRSGVAVDHKFGSAFNIIGTNKIFTDPDGNFTKILDGSIAPYCLAANNNVIAGLPANNYQSFSPGFKWKRITTDSASANNTVESPENNLDSIFSFDLVITPDSTKWSKCIVFETGESDAFTEGYALKGQIRKAASLNDRFEPQSDTGMSYFPGYVINLETGVRMNVCFGENSRFRGEGGANMIWDPDSLTTTPLGNPIIGGSHFVYIMNTEYSTSTVESDAQFLLSKFNSTTGSGLNRILNAEVANFYRKLAWTFVPLTSSPYSFYSTGKYRVPSEVRIKVRVEKPYAKYLSSESVYEFSTEGLASTKDNDSLLNSAFEKMTIVPNPYYAFSSYELNATQNTVKIVNVPKNSVVSIYTTDGMLVRKFKLEGDGFNDNPDLYGTDTKSLNYDNSIEWDLRTTTGVLVASGVYYVNVEAPNLGNKVLKLFAIMRSADVSNF